MNTNYKSSEVGGSPENQASTFKIGISFGQPVGEKKKESPSGEKDRDISRHKKVNKKKKEKKHSISQFFEQYLILTQKYLILIYLFIYLFTSSLFTLGYKKMKIDITYRGEKIKPY